MSASRRSRASQPSAAPQSNGADYPRRRTHSAPAQQQAGWRASKRSSKLGKQVRREARSDHRKQRLSAGFRATRSGFLGMLQVIGMVLLGAVVLMAVVALLTLGVNAGARWLAKRDAQQAATPEAQAEKARENLLIIGASDQSAEFLAVRLDETDEQLLGIAIPGGAFMEVPGQGFERVGDSYIAGPGVSLAAISNYLTVPFEHYVVVDAAVYQDAVSKQSLRDIMGNVRDTNLSDEDVARIGEFIDGITGEHTALVPLPVKPIDLGGQTYYEPQRDKIADLLLQWWEVKLGAEDSSVRVILYNGAGTPGIAGDAAEALIAAGMRVVDTKNADRFDYATTLIIVQDGNTEQGALVRQALGVGELVDKPSDQDVADVIIIIGQDYEPAQTGTSN